MTPFSFMEAARLCAALLGLYANEPRHQLEPRATCAAARAMVAVVEHEHRSAGITPALLAAIAINESSLDHRKVNPRSGTCGAMQVARPRVGCAVATSAPIPSYAAGLRRLVRWQETCRRLRRPTLRCALDGYRSGASAAINGGSGGVVLRRAYLIQRAMALEDLRTSPRSRSTRNFTRGGAGLEARHPLS